MTFDDLVLPILVLVFLVLLLPFQKRELARKRREIVLRKADEIRTQVAAIIHGDHRFEPVATEDFRDLDLRFYYDAQRRLESCGLEFLGDFEDLTMKSAMPRFRCFTRALALE